jgi:hypothetical protein
LLGQTKTGFLKDRLQMEGRITYIFAAAVNWVDFPKLLALEIARGCRTRVQIHLTQDARTVPNGQSPGSFDVGRHLTRHLGVFGVAKARIMDSSSLSR